MLTMSQESSSAFPSVVLLSLYWTTDDDEANALSVRRPLYMEQTSFRNVTSPSLICKLAQLSQRAMLRPHIRTYDCPFTVKPYTPSNLANPPFYVPSYKLLHNHITKVNTPNNLPRTYAPDIGYLLSTTGSLQRLTLTNTHLAEESKPFQKFTKTLPFNFTQHNKMRRSFASPSPLSKGPTCHIQHDIHFDSCPIGW